MRTNTAIYKHGICPKIYTAGFFRLKILHHQFHLILTVFSGKKHKKCVKMEEFTPLAKVLHLTEWIFLPKDLPKVHFLLGNDFFVLEWLVSGSRQEMGKSTFGLALSAQLIDLPLLPKVQWHLVEKARFRLYFHWFGNYITPVSMENKIST